MSTIRPLHDRVVVQRLENESKTAGGIFIPDTAGEKPIMGIVVAVGPGKTENGVIIEVAVKVGEKVLFGKYAGTEVEVAGQKLVVMREDDIMGIIEG